MQVGDGGSVMCLFDCRCGVEVKDGNFGCFFYGTLKDLAALTNS